jgi:hypothetical protein
MERFESQVLSLSKRITMIRSVQYEGICKHASRSLYHVEQATHLLIDKRYGCNVVRSRQPHVSVRDTPAVALQ